MTTLVQNALRAFGRLHIPYMDGVIWRLCESIRGSDVAFEIKFDGLRYRGRLDDLIDKNIFLFGAYAPNELDFLDHASSLLRRRGRFAYYDVGANVGQHALFMASRATRVIAFEPSAKARAQFAANADVNHLKNLEIIGVALGDSDGSGLLGSGLPNNSGSRSLVWSLDGGETETVAIRRGDDLLLERDLPTIDVLKLDVEGFEKRVLSGLRDSIRRDRPIILMELLGASEKGGFRDESDLRQHLYVDHHLLTLRGRRKAVLTPFDWNSESAVCLPVERASDFRHLLGPA